MEENIRSLDDKLGSKPDGLVPKYDVFNDWLAIVNLVDFIKDTVKVNVEKLVTNKKLNQRLDALRRKLGARISNAQRGLIGGMESLKDQINDEGSRIDALNTHPKPSITNTYLGNVSKITDLEVEIRDLKQEIKRLGWLNDTEAVNFGGLVIRSKRRSNA